MNDTLEWRDIAFLREVERLSGTPVSACVQCHKCSAGCPIGREMDLLSSQIMRLIHLGGEEEVLKCRSIWLCASCEACTSRCPMGIDVATVMDTLRILAARRKLRVPGKRGETFYRSFLSSVRRHGRIFELGMLTAYKFRCFDFLTDLDKARKLLAKRKLSVLAPRSANVAQVTEIFQRADEEERNR
ncbi:MAG TPA: 4Fe-4S dicluster domain-containing protein [bacterium]|nr:4Fe-4S dicluster domain-containing protein [bacterium]HQL61583.1 4Fe-4S dicluster domain-containing protein [bacterium]